MIGFILLIAFIVIAAIVILIIQYPKDNAEIQATIKKENEQVEKQKEKEPADSIIAKYDKQDNGKNIRNIATINITKKHIIIGCSTLIALIIILIGYNSYNKYEYKQAARELKINSGIVCEIAEPILTDYSKSWMGAINGDEIENESGKYQWCSDFNEALQWRHSFYEKKKIFSVLDSLSNAMKQEMQDMTPPPSAYRDMHNNFSDLYSNISTLISMCESPSGSYQEFNNKSDEVGTSILSKDKLTDVFFHEGLVGTIPEAIITRYTDIANRTGFLK